MCLVVVVLLWCENTITQYEFISWGRSGLCPEVDAGGGGGTVCSKLPRPGSRVVWGHASPENFGFYI